MTTEPTPDFELLEEEINQERSGFDLMARLTERPKRKPKVVNLYMDEEAGSELGYVHEQRNELGVLVKVHREGILGEVLDAEIEVRRLISEGAEESNIELAEAKLESLKKRRDEVVKRIKTDSLTVTLQWVPPMIEEIIEVKAMRSIGVKQKPLPEHKVEEFKKAWFARALEASVVTIVDNRDGSTKNGITVSEASTLQKLLPKEQGERLDVALNELLFRKAISDEALDNADF